MTKYFQLTEFMKQLILKEANIEILETREEILRVKDEMKRELKEFFFFFNRKR